MAKTSYEVALTRLLADEGGYSNLAADRSCSSFAAS
jgi:hypothetical protein